MKRPLFIFILFALLFAGAYLFIFQTDSSKLSKSTPSPSEPSKETKKKKSPSNPQNSPKKRNEETLDHFSFKPESLSFKKLAT